MMRPGSLQYRSAWAEFEHVGGDMIPGVEGYYNGERFFYKTATFEEAQELVKDLTEGRKDWKIIVAQCMK